MHHNNNMKCYENNGFSHFFGVHNQFSWKMSDNGLYIWDLLHYIPHFVVTWNPSDIV